jgi:hypothetical protein
MQKEETEFTDSAKDEIAKQLEEPKKHSGKEAIEIFPQPIKYIHQKYQKMKSTIYIRERSNATVIPFSQSPSYTFDDLHRQSNSTTLSGRERGAKVYTGEHLNPDAHL